MAGRTHRMANYAIASPPFVVVPSRTVGGAHR